MRVMWEEDDGYITGYMCGTDFECEFGAASNGNTVYPSVGDLKERSRCWEGCGIIEVKVKFSKVVVEPAPL